MLNTNGHSLRLTARRRERAQVPPYQLLVGGVLGLAGIVVLLVGRTLGLASYFVLQLLGQVLLSAFWQAASETLAGSAPSATDVALQAAAVALTVAGGALVAGTAGLHPSSETKDIVAVHEHGVPCFEAACDDAENYVRWDDES